MLGRLDEVHTKRKLKIYVEKTKGMMFEMLVEGFVPTCQQPDQVRDFVYLGTLVNGHSLLHGEIERQVKAGLRVVAALIIISKNHGLSK